MRRVLVTAGSSPVAVAIAESVLTQPDVESVVLVDERARHPLPAVEMILAGREYSDIRSVIVDNSIDTVIHAGLAPDRAGERTGRRDAAVISTMRVAAVAADKDGPVRNLVAISSTARYPAHSGAPTFHSEEGERQRPRVGTYGGSLAEAEDYLLALADQRPNLAVSILRFADLLGPRVTSPLSSMLLGRWAPRLFGYDPMVQFLHIDDAVHAVEHAVERNLAGPFNVATPGTVAWSQALRLAGCRPVWGVPAAIRPLSTALRALGVPSVPRSMFPVLQFGRVAAIDRLVATGWEPAHSVQEALESLRS